MRCLRQILHVKWQERVPDTEVLQRSNSTSIHSMIMESQLRWSGHVARMPEYRLPKQVFFGELSTGNRSRGRPIQRYKDTLKAALKSATLTQLHGKSLPRIGRLGEALSREVFPTMNSSS